MKYSEAEKRIKALSSKYDISVRGGDFDVAYNGKTHIIYVSGDYEYGINVGYPRMFSVTPFSDNVYMILAELAMTPLDERVEEKKQYIHVFEGQNGYLNVFAFDDEITFGNKAETNGFNTKFTSYEIEKLKQRFDIPLNWDKVLFEKAE